MSTLSELFSAAAKKEPKLGKPATLANQSSSRKTLDQSQVSISNLTNRKPCTFSLLYFDVFLFCVICILLETKFVFSQIQYFISGLIQNSISDRILDMRLGPTSGPSLVMLPEEIKCRCISKAFLSSELIDCPSLSCFLVGGEKSR